MYGLTVISLPAACGVVAATCTKNARRKQTMCPHQHAATASWWTVRNFTVQLSRLQPCERKDQQKKGAKNTKELHARSVLHGGSAKQHGATATASSTPGSCGRSSHSGKPACPSSCAAARSRSVSSGSRCVNSLPLDNMFRVVSVVQQIMTRVKWCCVRGSKNSGSYKNCLESNEAKWSLRVHRPLKVIVFNANGIGRQHYELSKQLQDLHIDVALFSETHLKPHEKFFIPNYHFYRTDHYPGRKGIPHNHVDLPPLVSVEATGVCIPIGNSDCLE
jgi:hypothetical protein